MDKQKATNIIVKIIWYGTFIGIFTVSLIFILISTGKLGYIPPFDELENPKTNLATEVYSADNVLLGKYYNENRTIVQFEDLSPNVVNALLATEDIRFYSHSGIDFRALSRVFVKTVLLGRDAGGGSTVSQQLAKNLYRMREKEDNKDRNRISRKFFTAIMKFQEWVTAAKLERNYAKDEIMVMYLNTVSFGHNAFGIKSAAFTFFGKTPDSLSLEDAAVLVGLLKAPTRYSPIINPDRAFIRRNTVYAQIEKYQKRLHKLTGWQEKPSAFFDSLKNKPIEIEYHKQTHNVGLATYFREFLRTYINANEPKIENYPSWNIQQYRDDSLSWINDPLYGWCNKNLKPDGKPYNIYRDGLQIYTTINSKMQRYAENAVTMHLGTNDNSLQESFEKQLKYNRNPPFSNMVNKKQVDKILERSMERSERWHVMRNNGKSDKEIKKSFYEPVRMSVFSEEQKKPILLLFLNLNSMEK